jgi:Membrane transport protein MerF
MSLALGLRRFAAPRHRWSSCSGAVGLTTWLAKADYVLIPAQIVFVALIAFGLERTCLRRR